MNAAPARSLDAWMVFTWLAALAGVILGPHLLASVSLGDDLIRFTVRLSLAYYALAAALMLALDDADWRAGTWRGRLTRWLWTLAWATFVVHLGMAFHYYHHWSHAHAVEHTRVRSGIGEGIYLSHLFMLLWTADVLAWWFRADRYAARSPWIDRALHAYMLFIVFNGTVVYESGLIRWAALACFAILAAEWCALRFRAAETTCAPGTQST